MDADGVYVIDGDAFKEVSFIPTGRGSHGLYPSRDGTKLYVTNRGTHMGQVAAKGMGLQRGWDSRSGCVSGDLPAQWRGERLF